MLCEICNEREANVVFTEVINGKATEHHLCIECAKNSDFGKERYAAFFDGDSHLSQLLSGLLGMALNRGGNAELEEIQNVSCPVCKTSYGEFVKRSRFGCPDCYDVFELLMEDHIKNLQGNTTHVGKRPMQCRSRVGAEEKTLTKEEKQLLQDLFGDEIAEQETEETASPEASAMVDRSSEKTELDQHQEPSAADRIAALKQQLQEALKEEAYGNAAKLRDEIRELAGGES